MFRPFTPMKSTLPLLTVATPIVPAQMLNNAGIVGAALAHAQSSPGGHAD